MPGDCQARGFRSDQSDASDYPPHIPLPAAHGTGIAE
jgi:hypothetical protein